jgi:hypothetical protein
VNLDDVYRLMRELAEPLKTVSTAVDVVTAGRLRRCVMTLSSPSDPGVWARVSTHGGGDYEIEVNGGFTAGCFDDLSLGRDDVREYLESYIRAAVVYLGGAYSIRTSRVFKVRTLTIGDGKSRLNLAPRRRWSTNDGRLAF